MSPTVAEELDHLVVLITDRPDGVSRHELEQRYEVRFGAPISSRKLQRQLKRLVDLGRIESFGQGRAVRYRSAITGRSGTGELVLSPDGQDIRRLVRRPIIDRRPVGYHRAFLMDYVPGETWYLTRPQREHLHAIGRTSASEGPAGTYARAILDRLLIDLSWSSSRLEGNTYSLLDTKNLIEYGQRAEGKDLADAQMILNHKHAIEVLVDEAADIRFDAYTVRNLHAALAEGLLADPAGDGRLRQGSVQISGSVFTPLGVPQQLAEYFDIFLSKAEAIPDPFEQAFFALVHIPYLQPFEDVNKRVSRIAANLPLVKQNLCPLLFLDVSRDRYLDGLLGVYELTRVELLRDVFLWAYERSTQQYQAVRESLSEPDPFRLRYRPELSRVLAAVVRGNMRPGIETVKSQVEESVSLSDFDRFVEMTFGELLNLHEGSIARYRIRPGEFRAWQDRWRVR